MCFKVFVAKIILAVRVNKTFFACKISTTQWILMKINRKRVYKGGKND